MLVEGAVLPVDRTYCARMLKAVPDIRPGAQRFWAPLMHVLAAIVAARLERAGQHSPGAAIRGGATDADGLYGAASSWSSAVPWPARVRNDSLLVFSSRRRTR